MDPTPEPPTPSRPTERAVADVDHTPADGAAADPPTAVEPRRGLTASWFALISMVLVIVAQWVGIATQGPDAIRIVLIVGAAAVIVVTVVRAVLVSRRTRTRPPR